VVRLFVTLIAALLVFVARQLPLPGVGIDRAHLPASGAELLAGKLSPVALGVAPYIAATLIVELFAAVVPSLRALRTSGPTGRAKLARASAFVFVAVAALQGWSNASAISAIIDTADVPRIVMTLVAGSSALLILASFVGKRGAANGILVVMAADAIASTIEEAIAEPRGLGAPPRPIILAGAAVAMLITWLSLRKGEDGEKPARAPIVGVWPVRLAAGALGATAAMTAAKSSRIHAWINDATGFVAFWIALTVIFTLALMPLLAEGSAASLWARATKKPIAEAEAEVKKATSEALPSSLTLVFLLVLVGEVVGALASYSLNLFGLALAAALILDVASELSARRRLGDLVPAWSDVAPSRVAAAARALREGGVLFQVRDARQRLLIGALGPFAPSEILVLPSTLTRAKEVLEETFPKATATDADVDAKASRSASIGAAIAIAVTLLVYRATPALPPPILFGVPADALRPELAVVAVDDEPDPFAEATNLPRGVRVRTETVPIGEKGAVLRHFAVVVALDEKGTDVDATLGQASEFFAKVALPPGDKVVFGVFVGEDANDKTAKLRTFVVRGEAPAVTGADIAQIAALPAMGDASPSVGVGVGGAATARLKELTTAARGRRIAMVIDGRVENTPVVMSAIDDGFFQITPSAVDAISRQNEIDRLVRGLSPR
jgi:hypothetical protein